MIKDVLLAVIPSIIFINGILATVLWRAMKRREIGIWARNWWIWLAGIIVQGVASEQSPTIRALAFLAFFPLAVNQSLLLEALTEKRLLRKNHFIFFGICAGLSILSATFGLEPVITAAFSAIGISFLGLILPITLWRQKTKLSFQVKIFSGILLLIALHGLDFPIFFQNEAAIVPGFIVMLILLLVDVAVIPAAIVEKIAMESARAEFKSRLEQTSRMSIMGQLSSSILHELSNPAQHLNFILHEMDRSLASPTANIEELRRLTGMIKKQNEKIISLVTIMRKSSRSTSQAPFETCTLNALMAEISDFAKIQRSLRHFEFEMAVPEEEITLWTRPNGIYQVVCNLIQNSSDAISGQQNPWIKLVVSEVGESIVIAVTDSGPGINSATAERMFDPFFSTKKVHEGTGLGLGICRDIMQAIGGTLSYDPRSSNTRFIAKFPKTASPTKIDEFLESEESL